MFAHRRGACGCGEPMLNSKGLEATCGIPLPRAEDGLNPKPSPRL